MSPDEKVVQITVVPQVGDMVKVDLMAPGGPRSQRVGDVLGIVLNRSHAMQPQDIEYDVLVHPRELQDMDEFEDMLAYVDLWPEDLREGPVYVLRNMPGTWVHFVAHAPKD